MLLLGIVNLVTIAMAIGENCDAPSTLWDKHTCAVIKDTLKYQRLCIPQRSFPGDVITHAANDQLKGVIILYHGYTACPDSFDYITKELQKNGYMTLVPLLPGHGINLGYGCQEKKTCVFGNINPTFLPIEKEGFNEWVDWSLDMVREEVGLIPESAKAEGFFVGALGLSAGGALGFYASSRPNTPITKFIAVNPFLGISVAALDFKVKECETASDPDHCVFTLTSSAQAMANATSTSVAETPEDSRPIRNW